MDAGADRGGNCAEAAAAPRVRGFSGSFSHAQQVQIAGRLRATRHLLILDNLESITGSPMAILNTLPEAGREALRGFLAELAGGRTLVLLGSRGGEEWLAKGTFGDNVYELPGLDEEAATKLADAILVRYGATGYREDKDFRELLELFDGYPLPIEIVLANLARQKPGEVLTALVAGDRIIDTRDRQKNTKASSAASSTLWQPRRLKRGGFCCVWRRSRAWCTRPRWNNTPPG